MTDVPQTPIPPVRHLRVFLCHSSVDKPVVRELYRRLVAENVEVWFDEESLLPGQDWHGEIRKAVREVDAVIVCISPESATRASYLQKELKYVLDVAEEQIEGTIFLIPLKLRPCDIPESLERWQAVSLNDEQGFERLMRSLKERAKALGLDGGPLRLQSVARRSALQHGGFQESLKSYEDWLRRLVSIVEPDLDRKHEQMKVSMFAFFRATYFRWAALWPSICPELTKAPFVLSVGDLHVSNFGTWRDRDARLSWGVNDFDEAAPLPYTNDLVRLAASALLVIGINNLKVRPEQACDAILDGYRTMLDRNGRPFVLSEKHAWLRSLTKDFQLDPAVFWEKLSTFETVTEAVTDSGRRALESYLPSPRPPYRVVRRIAGIGSLGRPRYVAIADWGGGRIAREIKALTPPATSWAHHDLDREKNHYAELLNSAIRARDLCADVFDCWIVRRLAPDTIKIELPRIANAQLQLRLLKAMGRETANVHLGSSACKDSVLNDLAKRPTQWLIRAAEDMVEAIRRDWWEWRRLP